MGEPDSFCWKCRKPCSGELLKFGDHLFHSDCLTCRVCNCHLKSQPIFEYEDHYYCGDDYHQNYGQKCHGCKQFVEGEAIAVHGNVYHESCFVCGNCRLSFPAGEKIAYDGKDYKCQNCVNKPKKAPSPAHPLHRCAGCGDEIKGSQALLALDKQWHLWCFTCTKCHTLLSGEYMGKDGKPYCEKDYHELYGVACAGCNGYITGKVLQAGDKHYHPKCSRCARCNQVFGEGEEMYLQGNEIWHPRCSDEAAQEERDAKAAAQVSAAPEPPVRSASRHTEWNNLYQQNEVGHDDKPPRESKPRPYSYHDPTSAAQAYNAFDGPPPSSETTPIFTSDIKVPLDLMSKTPTGEPRTRRYSTEDKDKVQARDFSIRDTSYSDEPPQHNLIFPYHEVNTKNYKLPKGVDKTQLETYLNDQDFFKALSMSRAEFYQQPKWKQNTMKKKAALF